MLETITRDHPQQRLSRHSLPSPNKSFMVLNRFFFANFLDADKTNNFAISLQLPVISSLYTAQHNDYAESRCNKQA